MTYRDDVEMGRCSKQRDRMLSRGVLQPMCKSTLGVVRWWCAGCVDEQGSGMKTFALVPSAVLSFMWTSRRTDPRNDRHHSHSCQKLSDRRVKRKTGKTEKTGRSSEIDNRRRYYTYGNSAWCSRIYLRWSAKYRNVASTGLLMTEFCKNSIMWSSWAFITSVASIDEQCIEANPSAWIKLFTGVPSACLGQYDMIFDAYCK